MHPLYVMLTVSSRKAWSIPGALALLQGHVCLGLEKDFVLPKSGEATSGVAAQQSSDSLKLEPASPAAISPRSGEGGGRSIQPGCLTVSNFSFSSGCHGMTAAWAEPRRLPLVHVTWSSASVFCPSRLFSLPLRCSVIDCSPGRGLEAVLGVNKALAPTGSQSRAGCSEVRFAIGLFLALFCVALWLSPVPCAVPRSSRANLR